MEKFPTIGQVALGSLDLEAFEELMEDEGLVFTLFTLESSTVARCFLHSFTTSLIVFADNFSLSFLWHFPRIGVNSNTDHSLS